MRFGILDFPGSNCNHDCYHAITHVLGHEALFIWHSNPSDIKQCDCLIIPGGFSYGDYLRPGAIAMISPALQEVARFADKGKPVIGICNGFQILLEAGLLPGAMIRNRDLRFICRELSLKTGNRRTPFTSRLAKGGVINIPIAHADGGYYAEPDEIKRLEQEERVLFSYCDSRGELSEESNPNGSVGNIAGICNKNGNVLGMMPHPERAVEKIVGREDGRLIFESMVDAVI